MQELQQYIIEEFERRKAISSNGSTEKFSVRDAAFEKFKNIGFPTTKMEEWKYSNIIPLLKEQYNISNEAPKATPDLSKIIGAFHGNYNIVLLNGVYSKELSSSEIPGISVEIVSDSDMSTANSQTQDSFQLLNCAFRRHTVRISVQKSVEIDGLVNITAVNATEEIPTIFFPAVEIVAHENSKSTLLWRVVSVGSTSLASLHCPALTVAAEENADVSVSIVQNNNDAMALIQHISGIAKKNSKLSFATFTLGGKFIRNTIESVLSGEHAELHLYGGAIGGGKTVIDNRTVVDHSVPNCESRELYKYILDGKSIGVFNGKIMVRPDAQKTNAYQSNKTILLSDGATINSKPQLEIFADDVKCSHGATSGQLDEEALFYLRTRGVAESKARALLLHAFIGEIADKFPHEILRDELNNIIALFLHDVQ